MKGAPSRIKSSSGPFLWHTNVKEICESEQKKLILWETSFLSKWSVFVSLDQ